VSGVSRWIRRPLNALLRCMSVITTPKIPGCVC